MATIITYNTPECGDPNRCFCQMKFDDNYRILISQSRDGLKIFRLLFGFIPITILFKANYYDDVKKHNKFISSNVESKYLLDHYVETIGKIRLSKEFLSFINNEIKGE